MWARKHRFSLPVFPGLFLKKKKKERKIHCFITIKFITLLLYWSDWILEVLPLLALLKVRDEKQHIWIQWDLLFSLRKSTSFGNKDLLKKKKKRCAKYIFKKPVDPSVFGSTLLSPKFFSIVTNISWPWTKGKILAPVPQIKIYAKIQRWFPSFSVIKLNCCCSLVAKSCLTLCNPMNCSPPRSSIHGISQARILEWVVISSSRGSSPPRDWTQVSCMAGGFYTADPHGNPSTVE